MIRYMLCLFFMLGCGTDYEIVNDHIQRFTYACVELGECLELRVTTEIDLTSKMTPLKCRIHYSQFTNYSVYPEFNLNIQKRPERKYAFLISAIHICRLKQEKGDYSKENQDPVYRFNQCVSLSPNNQDHRTACCKQYDQCNEKKQ